MTSAFRSAVAGLLLLALSLQPLSGYGQSASHQVPFSKEEIEQLVAPIALYPDALVAQILMASTYPLEVVSAARWVKANPSVKGQALETAMQQQPWDPSVKALTPLPQVLNMMNEKLDMTQRLGDAFLAQQKDVLDAVQRLRAKAQAAGNLKSGKEQVVSTEQQGGGTTIIKIEPANPQVVYVPTYNPTVVYGPWPYPAYPPYYYYPPGYVAGTAIFSFAVGVAVGNAMWGHCDWRYGNVNINVNRYNSFNRTNINNVNWKHNVEHRKGVQYRDVRTQQQYSRTQRAGVESREAFRGRADLARERPGVAAGQPGTPAGRRPQAQAAAFEGVGRGAEARQFSDRGASSRASAAGARGGGAAARGGGRR